MYTRTTFSIVFAFFVSLGLAATLGCSENCGERETCIEDTCVCNVGFEGPNCEIEAYKEYTVLSLNGSSYLTSPPFGFGLSWIWEAHTIRLDFDIKLFSFGDGVSLFNFASNLEGTVHPFVVEITEQGNLRITVGCYAEQPTSLESTSPVPLNEWTSLSIVMSGQMLTTCQISRDVTTTRLYIDKVLVGEGTGLNTPLILDSMYQLRTMLEDFEGLVNEISVWTYPDTVGDLREECEMDPSSRLYHCLFHSLETNLFACGALTGVPTKVPNEKSFPSKTLAMYLWTHDSTEWYFPLHVEEYRSALLSSCQQRNIGTLYLSNFCPSSCSCSQLSRGEWRRDIMTDFLTEAKARNISIYATYTDTGAMDNLDRFFAATGGEVFFEGITLNFEEFDFLSEGNLLIEQVENAKVYAERYSIPLHISLSFAWTNEVTYGGVTAPLHVHVISLLTAGDSIDLQVSHKTPCVVKQRMDPFLEATEGTGVKVFVTLETKEDEAFSLYSWYQFGENQMWGFMNRLSQVNGEFEGFVLHHYRSNINSGKPGWESIGSPSCQGSYDTCQVCQGNGSTCKWSASQAFCGNGECEYLLGENCITCSQDCPQPINADDCSAVTPICEILPEMPTSSTYESSESTSEPSDITYPSSDDSSSSEGSGVTTVGLIVSPATTVSSFLGNLLGLFFFLVCVQ